LPGVEIDEKVVVTSTGALELDKVPGSTGGGRSGRHRARARLGLARLGAKMTVVEYLDRILPGLDGEIAKQFQRSSRSRASSSSCRRRSRRRSGPRRD
jgi:dihydrolipoamide dehydrogenase